VPLAQFRTVTPGYFDAVRIPVIRGRPIAESDVAAGRPVAVVSESLARDWLSGIDPVGARVLVDDNDGTPRPLEIVGVVGNVQQVALDAPVTWDIYLPYTQVHPDKRSNGGSEHVLAGTHNRRPDGACPRTRRRRPPG
jgi:putative ABC transport system permease protein